MEVTSITHHRSRELVVLFKELMHRAERGELEASAVCIKPYGAGEKVIFTDYYRRNGDEALKASLNLSMQLNQLRDNLRAGNG
jgi:hypothetical protein